MLILVLIAAIFYLPVLGYSADSTISPICPSTKAPEKWRACEKNADCTSIYFRCFSEAINKQFEGDLKQWLHACAACDAAAVPRDHAKCKTKRCELDPPYSVKSKNQ